MNIFKKSALAGALLLVATGSASALTLNGVFDIFAVNATNLNSAQSQATFGNLLSASSNVANARDSFTYTGALDFGTFDGSDATTIANWLASGPGTVSGLDAGFGGLQQSKPNIGNGTATSTFFQFTLRTLLGAGDFVVTHDDGISIFNDGNLLGGNVGPTAQTVSNVNGSNGGEFSLLYVATNGDPSVLNVDFQVAAVPLPAALPLMGVGFAALGFVGWRRKRKAA